MITLCTVVPESHKGYLEIFFKSIVDHTKLISKILIAKTVGGEYDEPNKTIEKYKVGKIDVEKIEVKVKSQEHGHSIGLHACIDRVETKYIFFSDPDVFFLNPVDELYLNLKETYRLDYVGCSHHSALANAYGFFPYLVNSLIEKKDLPDKDFLKGHLKFRDGCLMSEGLRNDDNYKAADGKYLISGPVPSIKDKFPNLKPNILYDTGINLCFWAMQNNWKWISFQTTDCHLYTTKYYKGTKAKLPIKNLIWHSVRNEEDFKKSYIEFSK